MFQYFRTILSQYWEQLYIPSLRWSDLVEVLIIAFLTYHVLLWLRNTRAWSMLKGILVILIFVIFAVLMNMTTVLWIMRNAAYVASTAVIVILQPELRSAVESLGQRNVLNSLFRFDSHEEGLFSDRTINEIVRGCMAMARVKTGALIVIEQSTPLLEYERTGIEVDGLVTSQLLINIFEKNTPLHDGAVIIRENRITSATCYLPLSENKLDKDLGTRHRAGVGISEVTDSLTIIVSEETGSISTAYRGNLSRNLNQETLRAELVKLQNKDTEEKKGLFARKGKGSDAAEKPENMEPPVQ
ncbi:MAG: diadenylate cyclase CdaA [Lachnospiraceae bacterium]|nr:diadenylate cyclase CdaA [Lachnospiraceae bacterium]